MDIDHFKSINDTYGHAIGDIVLQHLSDTIKSNIRQHDIFARHGGEEFTLLLRQTDAETGLKIAEKLRAKVEQMTISTESGDLKITVSIGMTQFNDSYTELDSLIKRADQAMYEAKEKGRNQVIYIEA